MTLFLDTGILLRMFINSDPHYPAIRAGLRKRRQTGDIFATSSQNIAEFWNVSTRPPSARGGLGNDVDITKRHVAFIEQYCDILHQTQEVYEQWRTLLVEHHIEGIAVHDIRIVATMKIHRITDIVTLNIADFQRFSVTPIHPHML